jgi:hypothetical protein
MVYLFLGCCFIIGYLTRNMLNAVSSLEGVLGYPVGGFCAEISLRTLMFVLILTDDARFLAREIILAGYFAPIWRTTSRQVHLWQSPGMVKLWGISFQLKGKLKPIFQP